MIMFFSLQSRKPIIIHSFWVHFNDHNPQYDWCIGINMRCACYNAQICHRVRIELVISASILMLIWLSNIIHNWAFASAPKFHFIGFWAYVSMCYNISQRLLCLPKYLI